METKHWGSLTCIATLIALAAGGCGGRVLPLDGSTGGASGSAGTPAAGGSQSGGARATGGVPLGGFPVGGTPFNTGGQVGSCNPNYCSGRPGAYGCCVGPNGPCGVDLGRGCEYDTGQCFSDADCPPPPVPCQPCPDGSCAGSRTYCSGGSCVTAVSTCPGPEQCNPAFCAPSGSGKPCCLTQNGPCGVDYGMGCIPQPPPCQGCPPPPPPPPPVGTWYKSCAQQFCADAGQINPPICDKNMQPGMPCVPVGQACAMTYGCSPLLLCSQYDPCAIPL